MKDIEEIATLIRDNIRDLPQQYDYNRKEIETRQSECQELLHAIELTRFGTVQGYKMAKELQGVRQQRRVLKDENELLQPIVEALRHMKPHLKQLDKAIGEIRKVKDRHENRTYTCRVRMDLQEVMK